MPQDNPDYSQADAEAIAREGDEWVERKRIQRITERGFAGQPCTCSTSSFAMDIDRCPRHGVMNG